MRTPNLGAVAAVLLASAASVALAVSGGTDQASAGPGAEPARIAFTSAGRIVTVGADGSGRQVVVGPDSPQRGRFGSFAPTWSPDGTELALARATRVGRFDERVDLLVADADGSDERMLVQDKPGIDVTAPSWSPNGERLAFTRFTEGERSLRSEIVLIGADGSGEQSLVSKRIKRRLVFVSEPAWSPDGDRILFTKARLSRNGEYDWSLHVVDSGGGDPSLLRKHALSGSWSPDGAKIAFSSTRDENGQECGSDSCHYNGELYVMSAEGTDLKRLTRSKATDSTPDWSADGQRISFSSDRNYARGDGTEIYSIRPTGGCLTWLTNGAPASGDPDWESNPLASTTPSGCGGVPREPLIEAAIPRRREIKQRPAVWLGEQFKGLLLSEIDTGRRRTLFDYSDCGRYDPGRCPPPVFLQGNSACTRIARLDLTEGSFRFRKRHGALIGSARGGPLLIFTGTAELELFVEGGFGKRGPLPRHLFVFDHLRDFRGSRSSSKLPPPRLPEHVLELTRRAEAAQTRLGDPRAVADELDVRPFKATGLLQLADALERFGQVRGVDCSRH